MKVAWVTSWNRNCGIADYSKELFPEVEKKLKLAGHTGILVSIDETGVRKKLVQKLQSLKPDLIHFQHEYGLYGGKNPPLYCFPNLIKNLREILPVTKLLATAHTVLPRNFLYPLQGRTWQIPLRAFANLKLIPYLSHQWGEQTWGSLQGVIVHSSHQIKSIKDCGLLNVRAIPHFVTEQDEIMRSNKKTSPKQLLVFGFFSSDKGQDIVIDALKFLENEDIELILAGGVRRRADQKYFDLCKEKIKKLGLSNRVKITGFVQPSELQNIFSQTALVVAPFRSTSGSGSLAQSLGRALPILASDLMLNQEIADRVPGALELFESENPKDLSRKIKELLNNDSKLKNIEVNALKYAKIYSPGQIAAQTVSFYENTINLPEGKI